MIGLGLHITKQISGSSTPFYPSQIPGLWAGYDSLYGVTEVAGRVDQWNDVSENNRHLKALSAANRPQKSGDYIYFSGSPVYLESINNIQNTTGIFTMCSRIRYISSSIGALVMWTSNSSSAQNVNAIGIYGSVSPNTLQINAGDNTSASYTSTSVSANVLHNLIATFSSGGNKTLTVDGISKINNTMSSVDFTNLSRKLALGRWSSYMEMYVRDIWIWDRLLTNDELTSMNEYFA